VIEASLIMNDIDPVEPGWPEAASEVTACGVSRMVFCRATNFLNAPTIP
jgi:hypothetical protein